jgi:tetratricopeptide (TPR) repeat protein
VELLRRTSSTALSLRRRAVCAAAVVAVAPLLGCQYTTQGKNTAGVQLYQSGQYQQAAQYFTQALNQDPKNADAYYNLASTYHQVGRTQRRAADLDQAEIYYNKCLDFSPNHRDCYRALAVLLVDKNQPDKAQRLLENWYKENPSNPAPKVELARLREEFGDKTGAKEYLQQALSVDPYDVRALAALGRIQEGEGNTQQALANYERSLFRDQFQPDLAARVAQIRSAANAANQFTPPGGTRTVTTPNGALR